MTSSRLLEYLEQMVEAARLARSYVTGMSLDQFEADKRTQQAVVLNIIVIGEVANRLLREHPGFDLQHPGIPWRGIRGMRNRIAHGYFDLNMPVVWQTVVESLPNLIEELERVRAGFDASGSPA